MFLNSECLIFGGFFSEVLVLFRWLGLCFYFWLLVNALDE